MDNQISIQELYQIVGQKEVLIYKLQQQIQMLEQQLNDAYQRVETRRSGNGEADPRETFQPRV